jgi:hypothetical protein
MPLSDDEQRLLNQIEENLAATDPRLAQVADTSLYRHSTRIIAWAAAGVMGGFILMLATFTSNLVLGVVGFLVMLSCLLVIERHARRVGRAGLKIFPDEGAASAIRRALTKAEQQWRRGGGSAAPSPD